MRNITFDFLGQHRHGSAFHEYLRLRKSHFVDALAWDIPHNDEVEMDQYDNPCAHYSLVVEDGAVIGGARAMPTSARWGSHTYMLRDAARGCIDQIPSDLLPGEIASSAVWECTRLVISDRVRTGSARAECLAAIVNGLVGVATRHGATELITLTRPSLTRTLRQLGFPAFQAGEPYLNRSDNIRYAVLRMPAVRNSAFAAAA